MPEISSNVARDGRYSIKSYLNRRTSSVIFRTELAITPTENPGWGDEVWYGFSIYLPNNHKMADVWETVAQWHHRVDNWQRNTRRYGPPLKLGFHKGRWRVVVRWDGDPEPTSGVGRLDGTNAWDLNQPKTGGWTDWVFRVRWSFRGDGILEVWQDGKKVISRNGPNGYNSSLAPYFKMGVYNGWKDPKLRANSRLYERNDLPRRDQDRDGSERSISGRCAGWPKHQRKGFSGQSPERRWRAAGTAGPAELGLRFEDAT